MKPILEEEEKTDHRCSNCRKEIHLGKDLLVVERGVLGQRGPIPLGKIRVFCSEDCVSNFFNGIPDSTLPKLPPRIP